jgi:hypothetical protein
VRFQVLAAAAMKIRAFLAVASCSLVGVDRHFRVAYCLHAAVAENKVQIFENDKIFLGYQPCQFVTFNELIRLIAIEEFINVRSCKTSHDTFE